MPVEHNLYCYRGQSWKKSLYFEIGDQPLDLSGLAVKAQIRPTENNAILTAEINCRIHEGEGKVILELSSDETARITPGTYNYDLRMTDNNGIATYYIYGKFFMKGRVTR